MGVKDYSALLAFAEAHGFRHFAETLYNHGFTLVTLSRLSAADLRKMHIVGPKDVKLLLGAARILADKPAVVQAAAPRLLRRPPPGPTPQLLPDDTAVPLRPAAFTATQPTANEYARQATIFLEHRSEAREWPCRGSGLSRALNLTNASHETARPLYRIDTGSGHTATVMPTQSHDHGHSAKFCGVCVDHVQQEGTAKWQYQATERVLLGGDVVEHVAVWRPFDPKASQRIEYSYQRRNPSVKAAGKLLTFRDMAWGGTAVRRVEGDPVPFPKLRRKELAACPEPDTAAAEGLQQRLDSLYGPLAVSAEAEARVVVEQLEVKALRAVCDRSAAMVADIFAAERRRLEAAEEAARQRLVFGPELEAALGALQADFDRSQHEAAVARFREEAAAVARQQCGLLEELEAHARAAVEEEEDAFARNLALLGSRLHHEVRAYQARAEAERRAVKRSKGLPQDRDVRCPVCHKKDCEFFRRPWTNKFGRVVRDPAEHLHPARPRTIATLVTEGGEEEYRLHERGRRATAAAKKLKAAMWAARAAVATEVAAAPALAMRTTTPRPASVPLLEGGASDGMADGPVGDSDGTALGGHAAEGRAAPSPDIERMAASSLLHRFDRRPSSASRRPDPHLPAHPPRARHARPSSAGGRRAPSPWGSGVTAAAPTAFSVSRLTKHSAR